MSSAKWQMPTADYVGTWEWAQLDLQSIQHRDYFGHLSLLIYILIVLGDYRDLPQPWTLYLTYKREDSSKSWAIHTNIFSWLNQI